MFSNYCYCWTPWAGSAFNYSVFFHIFDTFVNNFTHSRVGSVWLTIDGFRAWYQGKSCFLDGTAAEFLRRQGKHVSVFCTWVKGLALLMCIEGGILKCFFERFSQFLSGGSIVLFNLWNCTNFSRFASLGVRQFRLVLWRSSDVFHLTFSHRGNVSQQ